MVIERTTTPSATERSDMPCSREYCRRVLNATSIDIDIVCASTPFACSTITRVSSARCNCSARMRGSRRLRSCRMPIIATSARACASAASRALRVPASVPSRFIVPITSPRRRIGVACTDRKPRCAAAFWNCGQASPDSAISATETALPLSKQSTQGPKPAASCMISTNSASSLVEAMSSSAPAASAMRSPPASTSSRSVHTWTSVESRSTTS